MGNGLTVVGDNGANHQLDQLPENQPWTLRVFFEDELLASFTIDDLKAIQNQSQAIVVECVSAFFISKKRPVSFQGLRFATLMAHCPDREGIQTVIFRSKAPAFGGPAGTFHETSLEYDYVMNSPYATVAWGMNDAPLPYRNGGPLRSTVGPDRYFYKSMKWLGDIVLTQQPIAECRGTWETYGGYHNLGRTNQTPEERFEATFRIITGHDAAGQDITRAIAAADWADTFAKMWLDRDLSRIVLAKGERLFRDNPAIPNPFSQQDYRNIQLKKGPFEAKIRGTVFEKCQFQGVDFSGLNFSLCQFRQCDFRGANMRATDLEGTVFHKCDLSQADFRDATLTSTNFYKKFNYSTNEQAHADVSGMRLAGAKNLEQALAAKLAADGARLEG